MNKCCIKIPLFLLLTFYFSGELRAQTECSFRLDSARSLYENGMIEEIPDVLMPCIEEGFTREQRIAAYKLMVLAYLFDDNQEGAEGTMLLFLDDFPNYEIRPDDAVEFVYLFESYRTISLFSIGFFMGPNISSIRTIEEHTLGNTLGNYENKMGVSTQFGLRFNRYLFQKTEANAELLFSSHNYKVESNISGMENVLYSESLSMWQVPLYLSYDFNTGKLVPFVYAGPSFGFITSVQGTPRVEYTDGQPFSGAERDISGRRSKFNISAMAGGGLKYKMPKGYIGIDIRMNYGFNNLVTGLYDNNSEPFEYKYVDNEFGLNSFFLSVGYHYTIYQPRKIRQ